MKTINIFGRKMPMVAILMALLVVGTASAAVFDHYASLSGNVDVSSAVFVTDVAVGGEGSLVFESPAIFEIQNTGDVPVIVEFHTTILDGIGIVVDDTEGLALDYSVIDDDTNIEEGLVLVPPGGLTVSVDFDTEINTVPDTYTIEVDVSPYLDEDPYYDFDGYNAMETLELVQKDGSWNPTGNTAEVNYIPMGNEFYYELSSDELEPDTEYTLIYYADFEDRFNVWGGNNPGAIICTSTTDTNGDISVSGHTDLGMNLPHPSDANAYFYDYTGEFGTEHGAKLWLLESANVDENFDGSNPLVIGLWSEIVGQILYENDLIQYTDTNQ